MVNEQECTNFNFGRWWPNTLLQEPRPESHLELRNLTAYTSHDKSLRTWICISFRDRSLLINYQISEHALKLLKRKRQFIIIAWYLPSLHSSSTNLDGNFRVPWICCHNFDWLKVNWVKSIQIRGFGFWTQLCLILKIVKSDCFSCWLVFLTHHTGFEQYTALSAQEICYN